MRALTSHLLTRVQEVARQAVPFRTRRHRQPRKDGRDDVSVLERDLVVGVVRGHDREPAAPGQAREAGADGPFVGLEGPVPAGSCVAAAVVLVQKLHMEAPRPEAGQCILALVVADPAGGPARIRKGEDEGVLGVLLHQSTNRLEVADVSAFPQMPRDGTAHVERGIHARVHSCKHRGGPSSARQASGENSLGAQRLHRVVYSQHAGLQEVAQWVIALSLAFQEGAMAAPAGDSVDAPQWHREDEHIETEAVQEPRDIVEVPPRVAGVA
mmetsp:Transcript_62076/g.201229  ORF Transcript_62076/g.201229 Transcript_62076/m.201229 type:complete len:269 (+) Transcript_62076:331-1137(+)